MDITYIPTAHSFICLATMLDWFTRRVLAWRVLIALESKFCREAVEEALAGHGTPETFSTVRAASSHPSTSSIKVLAARSFISSPIHLWPGGGGHTLPAPSQDASRPFGSCLRR